MAWVGSHLRGQSIAGTPGAWERSMRSDKPAALHTLHDHQQSQKHVHAHWLPLVRCSELIPSVWGRWSKEEGLAPSHSPTSSGAGGAASPPAARWWHCFLASMHGTHPLLDRS